MCAHTHKFWSLFNVIDLCIFCPYKIHQGIKHPTSNPHKQILFTTFWRRGITLHKIPTLAEQYSSGCEAFVGSSTIAHGERKWNRSPTLAHPLAEASECCCRAVWIATGLPVTTVWQGSLSKQSLHCLHHSQGSPYLCLCPWMISDLHEYLTLLQQTMEKDFR